MNHFFCPKRCSVDATTTTAATRASSCASAKGAAVVGVNDIPGMRKPFAELKQCSLSITYSVGSAEDRSPLRELLITNF